MVAAQWEKDKLNPDHEKKEFRFNITGFSFEMNSGRGESGGGLGSRRKEEGTAGDFVLIQSLKSARKGDSKYL